MKNKYTITISMDTPINNSYSYNPAAFSPGGVYNGYYSSNNPSYTSTHTFESDLGYEEFKTDIFNRVRRVREDHRNNGFMDIGNELISAQHIISVKVYADINGVSIPDYKSTGNPPDNTLL